MTVIYKKEGNVGVMTISRPKERNAWGEDTTETLTKAIYGMWDDDEVRAAILTGDPEGAAFSAGAYLKDPKTHTVSSVGEFLARRFKSREPNVFDLVETFPKPIVCAVNGYAIGIGCQITLCCDIIMAGEKADWRLTQVSLGVLPAYGGAPRLARWVGRGNALNIALAGRPVKGAEAYRIGLAQYLVPDDKLIEEAMALAKHLAGLPPLAAAMCKESVYYGMNIPNLRDAAQTDVYRFMNLGETEDSKEGHRAWRERRPPVFKGR